MPKAITSPMSAGPAGPEFEVRVGAFYLLSMLAGVPPRGLQNMDIKGIEFQRAAAGRPLDDVIIRGKSITGHETTLEIQVKRTITFAPKDTVFKDVVGQIATALKREDFWSSQYELAVATANTAHKISGDYQDVLRWARKVSDPDTFFDLVLGGNSGSPGKRQFIATFEKHLKDAGVDCSRTLVHGLLARFQILHFDFTATASQSEHLALERARTILHRTDTSKALSFWRELIAIALNFDADGGDLNLERLRTELSNWVFASKMDSADVRSVISESSRHALSDIRDSIGKLSLDRTRVIENVRRAMDQGHHWIELRGEPGVGKSGILKYFAEIISIEATPIILTPQRTVGGGWQAMRGELGHPGTAKDLLSELVCDGGIFLFIDNLDFYDADSQMTVRDLIFEAKDIPGLTIIVSARTRFGEDAPSWLPTDAVKELDPAEPIVVSELSDAEIEHLRHADPSLSAILSPDHPAASLTRNMFHLARLFDTPTAETHSLRTEVDMAYHWWTSAGSHPGDRSEKRLRARALKHVAEQAMHGIGPYDVSKCDPAAVDDLIRSGTFQELRTDIVSFAHDVLREWALLGLSLDDDIYIEQCPLDKPANLLLGRWAQLAAQYRLERDSSTWSALLDIFSAKDVHKTWRRAALIALIRTEIGVRCLTEVQSILLENEGKLLSEFIRTVLAVEVEPARDAFNLPGLSIETIPLDMKVLTGKAFRLISWLIENGASLPPPTIPDAVNILGQAATRLLGENPFTPKIVALFFIWLREIETANDPSPDRRHAAFGGKLDWDKMRSLEPELRQYFLLFCHHHPESGIAYAQSVLEREFLDPVVISIVKSSGNLAQVAPEQLATIVENALIEDDDPFQSRQRRDAFSYIDSDFIPESPNQGSFFELLKHTPETGLRLIRRLVDHAVAFHSAGNDPGDNRFVLFIDDTPHAFPWINTYTWSRQSPGHYCVTSGLMAIEAWAHSRIEAGDDFKLVIDDVLGAAEIPAAFLLVAVDLILCHWPESRPYAIPFVGCPELLSADRERQSLDQFNSLDVGGLPAINREPPGPYTGSTLNKMPSRSIPLENLLSIYGVFGSDEESAQIQGLLDDAVRQLGTPSKNADFFDPAFMAKHASNRLNRSNYQQELQTMSDGSEQTSWRYMPPVEETAHLEGLTSTRQSEESDSMLVANILNMLGQGQSAPEEFVDAAVTWAHRAELIDNDNDFADAAFEKRQIVAAAYLLVRDGTKKQKEDNKDWAREVFRSTLAQKKESTYRFQTRLQTNPPAIAFAGLVELYFDGPSDDSIRELMYAVASGDPAIALGLNETIDKLANIDARLPTSFIRCALTTSQYEHISWDANDLERERIGSETAKRQQDAVENELRWLTGGASEPAWPNLPSQIPRARRGLRLPGGSMEEPEVKQTKETTSKVRFDHQAAALWLQPVHSLIDSSGDGIDLAIAVTREFAEWTAKANGTSLISDVDLSSLPDDWNRSYFDLVARCIAATDDDFSAEFALKRLLSLPEIAFLEAFPSFLRRLDIETFGRNAVEKSKAVQLRRALAEKLMESTGWYWLVDRKKASIEHRIAPAIATMFFGDYFLSQSKCYLNETGIDQLGQFLPIVEHLMVRGPSHFVAMRALDLFEVSVRAEHLPPLLSGCKAWIEHFRDDAEFWLESGIGRRFCKLILDILLRQEEGGSSLESSQRNEIDLIMADLVSYGVAEAAEVERRLPLI